MVCTEVLLAVRALAHLVGKSRHVAGSDKNSLLCNRGALDLVVSFPDNVKIPPDTLYPPLHHRTQRPVIDETCNSAVTLGGWPDKTPAFGKFHHVLKNIPRSLYHYLSLLENAEFSLQIIPDRYYTSRFTKMKPAFLPPRKKIPPPAIRTAGKDAMVGLIIGIDNRHTL